MSGCAVSNKLVRNRSIFCLGMLLLAAILVLAPAAEAQDLSFDAEVGDLRLEAGVSGVNELLPEASGGNGDLTYSLSPDVPGLDFDAETRTLSGTPPANLAGHKQPAYFVMTYEAVDASGATATLTFNIIVEEMNVVPTFDEEAKEQVQDKRFRFSADEPMELVLPEASGGNGEF